MQLRGLSLTGGAGANPACHLTPARPGHLASLGISVDGAGNILIFYIGSDAALHAVMVDNNLDATPPGISQTGIWSTADITNSGFGTASNGRGEIFIFYQAGGVLKQVRYSDGVWLVAAQVSTASAPMPQTLSTAVASVTSTPTSAATDDPAPGACGIACQKRTLSVGASVGVGIGVTAGALLLVILLTVWYRCVKERRRDQRRNSVELASRRNPSLAHIRPYSSLGNLHWDELRRDLPA